MERLRHDYLRRRDRRRGKSTSAGRGVGGAATATRPFVRLQPALRFMHAHFREPIDMAAVAAEAGLSASQFTRLFKRFMGLAPMQYVIRQRIHTACHDLLATEKTAGEIALEAGFCDQSAFTRSFKEVTGQTPARYRRQHLAEWAQRTAPCGCGVPPR